MLEQEFIQLFYSKLNLGNYSMETQTTFLAVMTKYLTHGRKNLINGRTFSYIENKLEQLKLFLSIIDCPIENSVFILIQMPTILNTLNDFIC